MLSCALDIFQANGRIACSRLSVNQGETRKELTKRNENSGGGREGGGGWGRRLMIETLTIICNI